MRRGSVMGLWAALAMACGDDGTSATEPGESSSGSADTSQDDTTETSVAGDSSSGSSVETTAGDTTAGGTTSGDTTAGDTTAGETTAGETTASGESTSTGEIDDETTAAVSVSESSDSVGFVGFIEDPDGGVGVQCDIWAQDCPLGEKCNAWADDGGNSWNATGCFPVDPDPADPGEACTVEGSGVSGIDNCNIGSMCWNVDTMTNEGTCVSLCTGSPVDPVCTIAATQCVIANSGVLILCLPFCDPLAQDCELGSGCYPIDEGFACAPDASQLMGVYGDPCEFLNVCDPGLFCAQPEGVPDCVGSGCCSEFCDVTDPSATMNCPGFGEGQECVAWYEEGAAPPGFEAVGACLIPT
ncbi:MAG TPA: ribulose phosphate epimerase [Nannocystaceae bacterium]|nr:ribulose phosphate epimerase [Nannocystaceae bacterium]